MTLGFASVDDSGFFFILGLLTLVFALVLASSPRTTRRTFTLHIYYDPTSLTPSSSSPTLTATCHSTSTTALPLFLCFVLASTCAPANICLQVTKFGVRDLPGGHRLGGDSSRTHFSQRHRHFSQTYTPVCLRSVCLFWLKPLVCFLFGKLSHVSGVGFKAPILCALLSSVGSCLLSFPFFFLSRPLLLSLLFPSSSSLSPSPLARPAPPSFPPSSLSFSLSPPAPSSPVLVVRLFAHSAGKFPGVRQ